MKKGTAVKFIGTEKKSPIEKTYIWDIQIIKGDGKIVKDETIYLIQHPEGTLLSEETKKDFTGFNVEKLNVGKSYMAVYANEIIDLDNPQLQPLDNTSNNHKPTTNNQQPTTNIPMITVTLPRDYFVEVKDFLSSQKEQMETNKMVKFSMKKEEYNEMLNYFTEMIKATEAALAQPQQKINSNTLIDADTFDERGTLINNIINPTSQI